MLALLGKISLAVGAFTVLYTLYSLLYGVYRYFIRKPHDLGQRYGQGSWAFVTGATSGIGLALCKELATRGINVLLSGRTSGELSKAEKEVKQVNDKVLTRTVVCDLALSNEIKYFEDVTKQVEDIDISILINNAAVDKFNDLIECKPADCKLIFDTNLYSLVMLTKVLIGKLNSRRPRSAVINVSSISGVVPMPHFGIYSSTKAFVRYMTLALSEECKDNVDFMCLTPGFVTTKMTFYKETLDACSPETCARNTLNALGYDKETNGYWIHELQHFGLAAILRFAPWTYWKTVPRFAVAEQQNKKRKDRELRYHNVK